ncbi:cupin domain-containing protein [Thalassotalea ganghwensis]
MMNNSACKRKQYTFTKTLLALLLFTQTSTVVAFSATNLKNIEPKKNFENVSVTPLSSSAHSSEFIIFIKDEVKAHYHQNHTEVVYILSGEAAMTMNEQSFNVSAGDMVKILPGSIHAVKVLSKEPLKVLSIQSPEFLGKDRIYVTP